jgi:hypothetical protein
MQTRVRRIRSTSLALLLGLCIVLLAVGQGQAREFEIDGTADCGLKSGKHCSIDNSLALFTDDVSGEKQRVEIDVRWVKDRLDKVDQDDHVCLIVEDRGGGRLRATGYSQTCKFDDGTVNPGLSTGSQKVSEQPDRNQDDDHDNTFIPLAGTPIPTGPPGAVTGIVTNALDGQPIAGATVRVDNATASATTDSSGRFTISNAPSGSQTLRTTASGFVTEVRTITIPVGGTVDQAISLTPVRAGGQITIVLTWGGQPRDLDAHLSGPDRSGGRFHVFYANPSDPQPSPYASLDVDDTQSFGPETITIAKDPTTGAFVAGEYRYWVHNFSGEAGYDVSNARVTVNTGGGQLDSFTPPGGSTGLAIWRVVNLTIDTAGNVALTPVQTYATGFDTTPFSVPGDSPPAPTRK